jgi:hypothetical protein
VVLVHVDGTLDRKPWVETDTTTLIIGAVGAAVEVRTVEVVLLGGGPARRGTTAVVLGFEAGDSSTTKVLEGDQDTATLVLVVPKTAPPSILTARELLSSGDFNETRWTNPDTLTVLAPVPVVTP